MELMLWCQCYSIDGDGQEEQMKQAVDDVGTWKTVGTHPTRDVVGG